MRFEIAMAIGYGVKVFTGSLRGVQKRGQCQQEMAKAVAAARSVSVVSDSTVVKEKVEKVVCRKWT